MDWMASDVLCFMSPVKAWYSIVWDPECHFIMLRTYKMSCTQFDNLNMQFRFSFRCLPNSDQWILLIDIIFDISLKTFSSHKLLNIGQENALWLFRWSLTERFFHLLIICAVFYIIWPLLHVPQSLRVKQEILNSIFDYMFCLDTNIVHIVLHRFVPTCFSIYPYIQYSSFNILIFLPHVKLWPPIVDVVVVVDTSPVNSWTDS